MWGRELGAGGRNSPNNVADINNPVKINKQTNK
jgi:hypothetical protein